MSTAKILLVLVAAIRTGVPALHAFPFTLVSYSFGEAVSSAEEIKSDLNGDGYEDLAIGVHYEDIGDMRHAGALHVLYRFGSGTTGSVNQLWHQDSRGVKDTAEIGDEMAYSQG